jgi:hypothetical protein
MVQNKLKRFGIMAYATNNYYNKALAQLDYIVCYYDIIYEPFSPFLLAHFYYLGGLQIPATGLYATIFCS